MNNLEQCMNKLDLLATNFLNDTLDDTEKKIVNLLKGIIVIEKETITKERLFNQLKENYLNDDEATIEFIDKLYKFDRDAIEELVGMYIDEINSEDLSKEQIENKKQEMKDILSTINTEYTYLVDKKL